MRWFERLCWCLIALNHLRNAGATNFADHFQATFGAENIRYLCDGEENFVELGLTSSSGSGFRSNHPYMYGRLSVKLRLAEGNSAGVVSSFYMASASKRPSEISFEFLGNGSAEPYLLQTNVISEGKGAREQRFRLWFDPTAHHHEYAFLWNHNLIVFLVDSHVVRVFRNAKEVGVPFPDYDPMYLYSSIAAAAPAAVDWSLRQPFRASYTAWDVHDACAVRGAGAMIECLLQVEQSFYGYGPSQTLSSAQSRDLRWIRSTYMVFDYCQEGSRAPECDLNSA